jgi:hypothetical protein
MAIIIFANNFNRVTLMLLFTTPQSHFPSIAAEDFRGPLHVIITHTIMMSSLLYILRGLTAAGMTAVGGNRGCAA